MLLYSLPQGSFMFLRLWGHFPACNARFPHSLLCSRPHLLTVFLFLLNEIMKWSTVGAKLSCLTRVNFVSDYIFSR